MFKMTKGQQLAAAFVLVSCFVMFWHLVSFSQNGFYENEMQQFLASTTFSIKSSSSTVRSTTMTTRATRVAKVLVGSRYSKKPAIVPDGDEDSHNDDLDTNDFQNFCNKNVSTMSLVERAECGADFKRYYDGDLVEKSRMRIAFFGKMHGDGTLGLRRISGCPVNRGSRNGPKNPGCIQDKTCLMYVVTSLEDLEKADVVVIGKEEAKELTKKKLWDKYIPRYQENGNRRYRVLYIREGMEIPTLSSQKQVDFVMGVHFWNGLLNPNFLTRPQTYVNRNKQNRHSWDLKEFFGMSVISNCEPTRSLRGEYLEKLISELDKDQVVHQYGKCGNMKNVPSKPLENMANLAVKYKFYFAFENSIVDGYVTEKLFKILGFGPIPIYLGAPDSPRITSRKSYINVLDFKSPKELASYLSYLSKNATAYNEYHEWRTLPVDQAFEPEYLNLVSKQLPGRREYQNVFKRYHQVAKSRKVNPARVCACCRLCNRLYLEHVSKEPRHFLLKESFWSKSRIKRELGF